MGQIRFSVAMSLDGYIAAPNGEIDWILVDCDSPRSSRLRKSEPPPNSQMSFPDTVEVAVFPVMLGGGLPLLLAPANRAKLRPGTVFLEYAAEGRTRST